MNHLPATLLATAAAAAAEAGPSDAAGGSVVGEQENGSGEVLRRVIGDLKELETEASSSVVKVGCCFPKGEGRGKKEWSLCVCLSRSRCGSGEFDV